MNIIRKLVCHYIRNHMAHEFKADRDAIFRAIGEGVHKTFYEDNFNTRMNFTVLELAKNMPEALDGVRIMGKRIYHDSTTAAKCAEIAVLEAMIDVPVPEWRQRELMEIALKNG